MILPNLNSVRQFGTTIAYSAGQETIHAIHQMLAAHYPLIHPVQHYTFAHLIQHYLPTQPIQHYPESSTNLVYHYPALHLSFY
ncbi:hypothetical protein [Ectobacillus sp. sgz5001026]|uniref:hypothetical protein n=1 Tax=Ectobacillus sp. sgz5001026 TaxID=3242473 RepID=UPI0036D29355